MSDQYDRALIRLSTAEDEKLEPILAKLLPIVFDELLTPTDSAQKKLVNILNHVLTRAKGNGAIKLPALSILQRWFMPAVASTQNGPLFRNLSIIFLDLSIPRLSPQEQIDLSLYSLENFGKLLPGLDRVVAFLAAIPGLGQMAAEGHRKEQVPRCLGLLKSRPPTESSVLFFQIASEFLLIPCGAVEAASVGGLASASWSHWKSRLKSKSAADMVALKCTTLRWLASLGAEPGALVYVPSLVASVENYDAVCNMAESNCKRIDLDLDMDGDMELLGRLTCLGLTSAPEGENSLKVETKASVPAKLRQKVLVLLQRSRGIGGLVPYVVHLIRQSLRESEQVQQSALQLALQLSETVDPEKLVETSQRIMEEIEAVFWPGGGVIAMGTATPLAFKAFGSFARQLAERPSGGGRVLALESAPKMLRLLAANENAAQDDILEALSGLVACLRGSDAHERQDFLPLLDKLVTAPRAVVRREVLRWSSALFPASAPEGRYYALRLLGDQDPDLAKAAESALSSGGREAPPFVDMCSFLSLRALGPVDAAERMSQQQEVLRQGMPPLAAGFTWTDLARALSFLIKLAEAEGLQTVEDYSEPVAKKPRLSNEAGTVFVVLLDYILGTVIEGKPWTIVDEIADGETCLELALKGLHLATSLSKGHDAVLNAVIARAEALLLGQGTAFLRGGTSTRLRRLGARVLGSLAEQAPGTASRWLQQLEASLADSDAGRRAGAALAICELLRAGAETARPAELCRKVLGFLGPAESDTSTLAAACDGLRRLSERKPLVWEALDSLGSGSGLLDRVFELSAPLDGVEVSGHNLELIYASWRFLGQLAAWGGDESERCLDRLISIGKKDVSEEALAAMGLALSAAASDPLDPTGLEIACSDVTPTAAVQSVSRPDCCDKSSQSAAAAA
ncbi:unnamed protein product [Effrenium voratum]|nr:unnamed protein product [Effrenium voratum]